MKNTKASPSPSRGSSLVFIALLFLAAFNSHSQQLNVQVTMAFNLKSTNELNATNSFWFDGILSQAVGVAADPSNCGPVIATSPLSVTLEATIIFLALKNEEKLCCNPLWWILPPPEMRRASSASPLLPTEKLWPPAAMIER